MYAFDELLHFNVLPAAWPAEQIVDS
jgi:hypothetical protein